MFYINLTSWDEKNLTLQINESADLKSFILKSTLVKQCVLFLLFHSISKEKFVRIPNVSYLGIRPLHASQNLMAFMFHKEKKDVTRNARNYNLFTDKCVSFIYKGFLKKIKYPT